MSERKKAILFAAVMCIACSVLLTAASTGLKRFQAKNVALDKQKNILTAVGRIQAGKKISAEAVERIYKTSIRRIMVDPSGKIVTGDKAGQRRLPLYIYLDQDQIKAYIIPIDSKGLWGRIYGYLALEPDGSTIAGFTVYKHSETPGLGGEIEKRWFQKNFVGKRIVNREGAFVSISIAKGAVKATIPAEQQPNYVDGISGATLTGKFLTAGMKKNLLTYEPLSIRFRHNKIMGLE